MTDTGDISNEEITNRVLYAAFLPVVRLAASFRIPLSTMKKLLETAYFHEVRRRGLGVTDAIDVMHVSKSKSAQLSRQLKTNFLDVEESVGLGRRIEYMLWAEPLSEAKIKQMLPQVDNTAIESALAELLSHERVALTDGAYSLLTTESRRVRDSWIRRQDGLQKAMLAVGDTIFSRFFRSDSDSFARSLSLHVRDEDIPKLYEFYEKSLFPFLSELNETADESGDGREIGFSIFWSDVGSALEENEK